jgi:hypothetical protein
MSIYVYITDNEKFLEDRLNMQKGGIPSSMRDYYEPKQWTRGNKN